MLAVTTGGAAGNNSRRRGSMNVTAQRQSVNSISSYQMQQAQLLLNNLPIISEESGSINNKQVITTSELLKKRAYPMPGEAHSINEIEKNQTSKIENKYMRLILLRTMTIFFLCVISAPLFMDTLYYYRNEMVKECFQTFY